MSRPGRPQPTAPFPVASLDPERRLAVARTRIEFGLGVSPEMQAKVWQANDAALRELAAIEAKAMGEV